MNSINIIIFNLFEINNKVWLIFLVTQFNCLISFSQNDTTENKNLYTLKTDFLTPVTYLITKDLWTTYTFEYGFKEWYSVQISGLYAHYSSNTYSTNYTIYIIEDFKSFQQKNKSPYTGLYVGGYCDQIFEYAYGHPSPWEYIEYKTTSLSIGPVIGYQNYIHKRLVFDFIFGIAKRFEIKSKILREEGIDLVLLPIPIDFRLAFNIGYRF